MKELRRLAAEAVFSVEDNRAVTVHEDTALSVPGHRASEHRGLDVLTALDEVGDIAIVVDAGHVLLNNRPLVQVRGDVVGGGTDDLDTTGMRLVIGLGTFEAGQERMVDVDDTTFEPGAEIGGEDLHIPGEDDEFHIESFDEAGQLSFGGILGRGRDRNVVEVMTMEFGQRPQGLVVAGDADDIDGQLTRALLEQQGVEAMGGFGYEHEGSRAFLNRLQAHRHIEPAHHLGESGVGIDLIGGDKLQAEKELLGVGGGELLGLGDIGPERGEDPSHCVDDSGRIRAVDSQDPFSTHGSDSNRDIPRTENTIHHPDDDLPDGVIWFAVSIDSGCSRSRARFPTHHFGFHRSVYMTENSMQASLADIDPQIAEVLDLELGRQRSTLEMIASENFVPRAVLQAQGSVLTNKYAEGYPGKRYYGGCEHVDVAETLAIDRAKSLFGAEYANVQPHSGASANAAVMHALARHGDKLLGLSLAHGGHLTHGMKINFSGRLYDVASYEVDPDTYRVDMDKVRERALEHRPKVIVAGWSAYSRQLDFQAFRDIADEVGAKLWVDMAHFAGLVAAGLHPNPVPFADVVSSTVHKTIGGPRSGFILAKEEYAKKLNSAVFPGQQGGPLMHVIAAKAVAFKLAASAEFKARQERTVRGAQILAERLMADDVAKAGATVLTGGTDVHLVLVDLRNSALDGQQAEDLLHEVGITVNRNAVPFDPRPPMVTSGLRIGTPALATRGFDDAEFTEVADVIAEALKPGADVDTLSARIKKLSDSFPLYEDLEQY